MKSGEMALALPPELEERVCRKTSAGAYRSGIDVIEEALRLLDERDRDREEKRQTLHLDIALGLEQLDRGEFTPFNDAAVNRIIRRGEQRLADERREDESR